MAELSVYLFTASLVAGLVLTPVAIRCAWRWAVLDHPGPRKVHRGCVPLSGGWVLFAVLTLILWGHLLAALAVRGTGLAEALPDRVQYFVNASPELTLKILPIYAGAIFVFLLGVADDLRGRSVRSRLVPQVILAATLVALGVRPQLEVLPEWATVLITILWIVGITNAFNFLDGLDGLSTGVAFVATLALLFIMTMGIRSQPALTFFLATLAGTQLGLLRYNFHPARVFLGSSGSLLLGYLLATSTLLVTYVVGDEDKWLAPLLTPVFILAIPIYDTGSVVLIRLLKRRSIAIGDQSHFHHRLLRLGFSQTQAVVFIYLIAFAVALSAVRLTTATFGESMLVLLQILAMLSVVVLAERVVSRARRRAFARHRRRSLRQHGSMSDGELEKAAAEHPLPSTERRPHEVTTVE